MMSPKAWWSTLAPEAKRNTMLAGMVVGILLLAFVGQKSRSQPALDVPVKTESRPASAVVMTPERRDLSMGEMQGRIDAAARKVDEFRQGEGAALKQDIKATQSAIEEQKRRDAEEKASLVKTVKDLQDEIKVMRSGIGGAGGGLNVPLPALPGEIAAPLPANAMPSVGNTSPPLSPVTEPAKPAKPRLRVSDADANTEASTPAKGDGAARAASPVSANDGARSYLPAGSIIDGVLLAGMDAPTSGMNQKNPVPGLIRIKREAILPNRKTSDISECFVVISGFGVMATERAQLRSETISCVNENNDVAETELNGYVIGEDGKAGLRGRLVSKQGAVIAKSLAAGFLSGLGNLAPTSVPQLALGTGDATARPNPAQVGESALYKGVSSATSAVSQFYLDMAKEMFPVIEIDAARQVSIVLVKGAWLNFGKGAAK